MIRTLLVALALLVVPAAASGETRERWDTRVLARVESPGFPAQVYVHPAAVELMEQDCAVLTRAETTMSPATAASLRSISGLQDDWVSVVARPRRCAAPERQYDRTIGRTRVCWNSTLPQAR